MVDGDIPIPRAISASPQGGQRWSPSARARSGEGRHGQAGAEAAPAEQAFGACQPCPPPRDAIIAVTGHCNAHCIMCNVWKHRGQDVLRPEHMARLPSELASVNLSGGEPFLRSDLPEFVAQTRRRCPQATITISTNGYLSQRIADQMDAILRADRAVRLAVSLDGLGPVHDTVRGDAGAYDSVLRTLDLLQQRGFKGLRLSMTLSRANADQVQGVADLARRRGLELSIVAAHRCRTHMRLEESVAGPADENLRRSFEALICGWLRSWNPRQWLRAHFAYHTYRYLAGRPKTLLCPAGRDFFFVQADGTVYSCGVDGHEMGNLAEQEWDELWHSPAARAARQAGRRCGRDCWMVCTVRSWYRRHGLGVLGWALGGKLLAHLRLLRLAPPSGPTGQAEIVELESDCETDLPAPAPPAEARR